MSAAAPQQISTLNEKHLHAALKRWYARPEDLIEQWVDGYLVDLVRGDLLVEIQTRNFAGIKRKMHALTAHHPVRLVHPIAQEKWIVKIDRDAESRLSRRKSPKRGEIEQIFEELVSFPELLSNPNFSLEVLLVQEEEVRRYDGVRGWRRKGWVTHERRLLRVVEERRFETPESLAALIPPDLTDPFTTLELAAATRKPRWLAQKMAYCLRQMGTIEAVGKAGNAVLYTKHTA